MFGLRLRRARTLRPTSRFSFAASRDFRRSNAARLVLSRATSRGHCSSGMPGILRQPERALAHSTGYNSPMSTILKLGDPRLRAISIAVEPGDPTLQRELQDLAGALRSFRSSHGWGRAISLPQLGTPKRVIAFDLGVQPFFVLNPIVEWVSEEKFELWDDCMCMPEIAVRVERARSLTISFVDESMQGRRLERVSSDVAELIQHELDHLDGVLLTDRMIPAWGVVARELRDLARPRDLA
jgi:peptide deformylase